MSLRTYMTAEIPLIRWRVLLLCFVYIMGLFFMAFALTSDLIPRHASLVMLGRSLLFAAVLTPAFFITVESPKSGRGITFGIFRGIAFGIFLVLCFFLLWKVLDTGSHPVRSLEQSGGSVPARSVPQ